MGWYTASSGGTQVNASTVMGVVNTTVYAQWEFIDSTPPTISRTMGTDRTAIGTSHGGGAAALRMTYNVSDNESGLAGYYWGTTYPTSNNVTYTSISGTTSSIYVEAYAYPSVFTEWSAGEDVVFTYYLAVIDKKGNLSVTTFSGKFVYIDSSKSSFIINATGYSNLAADGNTFDWVKIYGPNNEQLLYNKANSMFIPHIIVDVSSYSYIKALSGDYVIAMWN